MSMPNSISSASGWLPRVLLYELRGATRNKNGQGRAHGGSQQKGGAAGRTPHGLGKRGRLSEKPVTMGRAQGSKPSLGLSLSQGEGTEDQ